MINIDLFNDYAEIAKEILTSEFNINSKCIPEDSRDSILLLFKVYRQQVFLKRPWQVHVHPNIKVDPSLSDGFNALKQALSTGQNIEKFLSTIITRVQKQDVMLDCENIYHFHLSNLPHKNNNRFYARTSERAFVYCNADLNSAYIIDIYKHDAEKTLIQDRIIKLWKQYPDACKHQICEGELSSQYDDSQINEFRSLQINTLIKLDNNHFFIPDGGLTMQNRVAQKDVLLLNKIVRYFRKYEKDLIKPLPESANASEIKIQLLNKDKLLFLKKTIGNQESEEPLHHDQYMNPIK